MARKPKPRTRPEKSNPNVTLFDAVAPLILSIEPRDIANAKRGDGEACAAAHAICRQEHVKRALVCKTKTYVWHKDGTVERFITPRALRTEILIFDRHGQMEGGDYRLMPPTGVQRLGHHVKPTGPKLTTGKVRSVQHVVGKVRPNAPKGPQQGQAFGAK
jgi:hypothetical protein